MTFSIRFTCSINEIKVSPIVSWALDFYNKLIIDTIRRGTEDGVIGISYQTASLKCHLQELGYNMKDLGFQSCSPSHS